MTIFGFNTDVRHAEVVYHVQSEARQNDLLLQTLIYVKGQCVGKHAFSYAAQTLKPDFSEAAIHELLKAQHKRVIESLQGGHLDSVLIVQDEIGDVGGSGLTLRLSAAQPVEGGTISISLQVLDAGKPAVGAEIAVYQSASAGTVAMAHARSDSYGRAEVELHAAKLEEPAVIVQAVCGGKSVTRKIRLRK